MRESLFYFGYRKEDWTKNWYQLYDKNNQLIGELNDKQWKLEGTIGKNTITLAPSGFWLSKNYLQVNDIVYGSMFSEKWWSSKKIIHVDGLPDHRLDWKTSYKSNNVLEVIISEKDNGLTRMVIRKEKKNVSRWKLLYYWKVDADETLFKDNRGYWLLLLAFSYFANLAKGESAGTDIIIPGKEED